MAVHAKNKSFAEIQKETIVSSVQNSAANIGSDNFKAQNITLPPQKPVAEVTAQPIPTETKVESVEKPAVIKTVTSESGEKKRKDVLIGIHVTEDERNELRKMFCSNGFSLATAYRAAMTYLRQDIELGKAYITSNGEIFRK